MAVSATDQRISFHQGVRNATGIAYAASLAGAVVDIVTRNSPALLAQAGVGLTFGLIAIWEHFKAREIRQHAELETWVSKKIAGPQRLVAASDGRILFDPALAEHPDMHWDWAEIHAVGDPSPRYVKVACRHLDTVPVDLLTGETVARICLTCDADLPPSG